jgi:WD40 repeat protein
MLISGLEDGTIRVWDLSTGELDDTFTGIVCALVVEGRQLYSASEDGTIHVWEAGTWAEANLEERGRVRRRRGGTLSPVPLDERIKADQRVFSDDDRTRSAR